MKDIALHVLDIAQNSVRAGSGEIKVLIDEAPESGLLTLVITDDGKGMDEETCRKAVDPYFTSRTTRKVGLGLPLLAMNASLSGGNLTLKSASGMGTTVTATFMYDHIDRPPMGDIAGTVALLITSYPEINFVYCHTYSGNSWSISTEEVREALGGEAVTDLKVTRYLREIIRENISELTNIKEEHDNY